DDDEGWVDEVALLSENERCSTRARAWLVFSHSTHHLHKLTFKILHSTTILLPAWKSILKDLKLAVRIMLHDVSTCWNSTYDMLNFALEYWKGIDAMTDTRKLGLGEYELKSNEWMLVKQLHDVLKVCDVTCDMPT
ncbi:hypothetical protein C8R48DRAFT_613052, partial [Suillus tomentosus]